MQFVDWYSVPPENQSEDCLYLDVFAPARSLGGDALLPIWVYFHGGSFAGGQAGATWSIPQLVGVVVVAPQYRLGAFGFYAPEVPPPNFGIQDQRLALRWVQENARAFGGDPQRVMIMGNSAGSASVAGHLVMPESFGLYSSASMESPGGHQGWMGEGQRINDDWTSTSILLKNSVQLAKECGCGSSEDLTCMQAVPIDDLMKNAKPMRFAPALGSEGEYPLSLMREGKYHQVPIIVGGTNCESCANAQTSLGKYTDSITQQEYDDAVQKWVQGAGSGASITVEELTDWYAGDCAQYGYWRCFAQMDGESGHTCSAALTAEALRTTSSTVWRYLFTEKDPAKDFPGASHASEGSYLFGAGHPMPGASPAQDSLSRDMAFWWMSLAAHGDPNAASASKVTWTAYTEEDAQVMFLSDDPHMRTSAATATPGCEHWKPYLGWGED
jgi:para-nitrobenzyl esterase